MKKRPGAILLGVVSLLLLCEGVFAGDSDTITSDESGRTENQKLTLNQMEVHILAPIKNKGIIPTLMTLHTVNGGRLNVELIYDSKDHPRIGKKLVTIESEKYTVDKFLGILGEQVPDLRWTYDGPRRLLKLTLGKTDGDPLSKVVKHEKNVGKIDLSELLEYLKKEDINVNIKPLLSLSNRKAEADIVFHKGMSLRDILDLFAKETGTSWFAICSDKPLTNKAETEAQHEKVVVEEEPQVRILLADIAHKEDRDLKSENRNKKSE